MNGRQYAIVRLYALKFPKATEANFLIVPKPPITLLDSVIENDR